MANSIKLAALALIAPGILASAAPAMANDHDDDYGSRWSQQDRHRGGYDNGGYNGGYGYNSNDDYYARRGYDNRGYDNRGYDQPQYRNVRTWRGNDGRTYCRRQDGTTGLLIGGVAGGVIGHEIAGRRGDRTLGAILGAGVGALIGREIDKSSSRCR